ncbi:MAG: hypothetical protein SFT92_01660 [Rickettsiales bacterium]|nr:hypothetical protein [Rickettsiales bacterium]
MKPEANNKEQTDTPENKASSVVPKRTLKAAGRSFLLADAALFSYGIATKNPKIGAAALFGWTEGFVGARYGNPKVEKQLEQTYRHLGEYLREQGVEIPKDPTTEALRKEGGLIDHVEDFLYKYPSQIMNACYAMIGTQFARDGLQNKSKSMIASGGFLIAGALAGLLITEKKFDDKNPPKGLWQKIQQKPLRLTGTLLNLNLVTLTADALKERTQNPGSKSYLFKLLAVAGFGFGNTMMALSSKDYGGGSKMDEKSLNELAETSALVIASQPPEVQKSLLEHISGYLASQSNVNMKAGEISQMLHKKMAEVVAAHPAVGPAERASQASAPQAQPSL